MKGSSGATLAFSGDFIRKKCKDATEQCEWFQLASQYSLASGIRLPHTIYRSSDEYDIEFVEGVCGTRVETTRLIDTLVDQILLWSEVPAMRSNGWDSYLSRLHREHVVGVDSEIVRKSFEFFHQNSRLPSSFCHGDLTLENVLVEITGDIVLIDPNFKKDLFQSYVLDLGKLLQSVHSDYHRIFNSHSGSDPAPLCGHLRERLGEELWHQARIAEISHILRLRKYRPKCEHTLVDNLLEKLLIEVKS